MKKGSLARNAGWLLLGQGFSFLVQAGYFVVLARLLGVFEYGIYAGAVALVSIASKYSTFGSGFLVLRYVSSDAKKFAAYWGNILFSTFLIGGLLVLGIHLFGGRIAGAAAAPVLIFVAVGDCICGQLSACCAQIFQTFEKMNVSATLATLTNVMRLVAVLALSSARHHAEARQWAQYQMGVSIFAALLAVTMVIRFYGLPAWKPSLLRVHGFEALSFAVSGSTTSVYNDIDKTMLSHYGMSVANGVYTMAYRVIDIAMAPVQSIHAAAFPRFCKLGVGGVHATWPYAWRILKRTVPLGAAIALVLCCAAPLLPLFVGKGFEASISALWWLSPLVLFRCFHLSAGDAITGAGYQHYRLAAQLVAALGNFGVNLWLIPAYGWHGAAWSSLATDGVLGIMNWGVLGILLWSDHSNQSPKLEEKLAGVA